MIFNVAPNSPDLLIGGKKMQDICINDGKTITQDLIDAEESFDLLHGILELIIQLPWLKVHAAGIYVCAPLSQKLKLVTHINFPAHLQCHRLIIQPDYCLCGQSEKSKGMLLNHLNDNMFSPCAEKLEDYQLCKFPIKHSNGNIGVLVLLLNEVYEFTTLEVSTLEGFTDMIGKSIYILLNNQEKQLSELILAQSKYGILITNSKLKITWVNNAFERTTGYSLQEAIGESPGLLRSSRHDREFYRSMWREIYKTGLWEGDVWNKRKDGSVYPELLSIVALKNQQGETLSYAGMFIDLTSMKAAEEKIRKMAYFDSLTDLPSRDYFQQHLQDSLKAADRNRRGLALLFIDLDGFKEINDTLGHDVGDLLLKKIAQRLKASLRDSDFIARLGGDEFCIILENTSDDDCVSSVVNSCQQSLNKPIGIGGHNLQPTVSVGIAYYPDDAKSQADLLKAADNAMYTAKRAGKHCYRFFHSCQLNFHGSSI